MYQSYWGLHKNPFGNRLDPKSFCPSPIHEEALARLHFLVEERRRLGILLGEPGTGKSLLLEVFAGRMRDAGRPVAKLDLVGIDPTEFLAQLAAGLGVNSRCGLATPALWRIVSDRLAAYRYQNLETVILLDDADQAGPDVLSQLARLVKCESSPHSQLTIVLAGQPEHARNLGMGVLDLIELRIDLEAWEPADTTAYLQKSLAKAGCGESLFDEPAMARLHDLAQGIPRRVAQLANLALLAGVGRGLHSIDAETVESACQELGAIEV